MYLSILLTIGVVFCMWLFRNKLDKEWVHPFLVAAIIIYSNYFVSIAAEVGSSRHRIPTEGLILVSILFALPIVSACRRTVRLADAKPSSQSLHT
jgi:hypothetical protein